MKLRDRIIDFRRVPASELLPHPKNWRTHPAEQADAMRGVLSEVGIAGAMIARETEHGLQIIDGHLRADVAPDSMWPVLVLDVNDEETNILLGVYDPIGDMAGVDDEKLIALVAEIETESEVLRAMLDEMKPEPVTSPEDFQEIGEDIETEHSCPKCGYAWSGGK
jgi:hypothetical protein